MTGDAWPGAFHPELVSAAAENAFIAPRNADPSLFAPRRQEHPYSLPDEDEETPSAFRTFYHGMAGIGSAFFGGHGLLSHFPIMIFGVIGMGMIMHRHWPNPTKVLAAVTLAGGLSVILIFSFNQLDGKNAMFATRWFVAFLPLTLFWGGAWLRRPHARAAWAVAGVLLTFSVAVSLIGATGPEPRDGFDRYTPVGAIMNLIEPPAAQPGPPAPTPPVLAQQ